MFRHMYVSSLEACSLRCLKCASTLVSIHTAQVGAFFDKRLWLLSYCFVWHSCLCYPLQVKNKPHPAWPWTLMACPCPLKRKQPIMKQQLTGPTAAAILNFQHYKSGTTVNSATSRACNKTAIMWSNVFLCCLLLDISTHSKHLHDMSP